MIHGTLHRVLKRFASLVGKLALVEGYLTNLKINTQNNQTVFLCFPENKKKLNNIEENKDKLLSH
jgi:hypothetical protein